KSENEINTKLLRNEQLTIIMIAHRLNSVKNCDRIVVVEKGQIVGDGTHEELLRENLPYKNLWGQI
ncbi:MAG: ABC transporter ATP-binding protein, partial [Lachnospiraceae bacterium]|nr:ABC transporter ATP-binding protein [Lachnospiraceae bacterium]